MKALLLIAGLLIGGSAFASDYIGISCPKNYALKSEGNNKSKKFWCQGISTSVVQKFVAYPECHKSNMYNKSVLYQALGSGAGLKCQAHSKSFLKSEKSCPSGYSFHKPSGNAFCQKVEVKKASCNGNSGSGWYFSTQYGKCIREVAANCPSGKTKVGDYCVKIVLDEKKNTKDLVLVKGSMGKLSCSNGYTIKGDLKKGFYCSKVVPLHKDKKHICSNNKKPYKGLCIFDSKKISCTSGFTYSSKGKRCEKVSNKSYTNNLSCSHGAYKVGKVGNTTTCLHKDPSAPTKCPKNSIYTIVDGKKACFKKEKKSSAIFRAAIFN